MTGEGLAPERARNDGLPERLAREARGTWMRDDAELSWGGLDAAIAAAIRQALDEAATVARSLPLRWDAASMDEVVRNRDALGAAIEALK